MSDQAPAPIPLVLLPGLDGTGVLFGPLLAALGPGFAPRVVRYPAAMTSYRDCVDFARGALPTDRPFLLLGESFSGPVAIALAAEHPAGLEGLLLCVTFARNPQPRLAWAARLLPLLPPVPLPLATIRRLLLDRWDSEPLRSLLRAMRSEASPASLKARLQSVVAVDHTALLDRIQVPALALCASRDHLVPPAAARWMLARCSRLERLVIDGPHCLLQARPEACAEAIQAFRERVRTAPQSPAATP